MRAGSGASTFAGGTLASGVDELIVHQYATGELTINSSISAANGLTKTGPGSLTLGGVNAGLTGPVNVNRGSLRVTAPAAVNAATTINLNDNRNGATAALSFDFGDGTSGGVLPAIRLSAEAAGFPTILSTGARRNARVTLGGLISSAPGAVTGCASAGRPTIRAAST